MSWLLKKSIKNNSITKLNIKEGKCTDKSGRVLLNKFLLALLWTQRSCQSTHPLHKHEQHRTLPVFRSGRNEFYDRNIPYCRLLGLIIYQLSLFSDYSRHCWSFEKLDRLAIHQIFSDIIRSAKMPNTSLGNSFNA